ncbi:MAG: hypothetical protein QOH68_2843 [Nocardioidaceae bacterium]|nr:hypothetical protein [Nocardioidaceae bacterium]
MVGSTARIEGDSSSFNPIFAMQLKATLALAPLAGIAMALWGGASWAEGIAAGFAVAAGFMVGALIQRLTVFRSAARVTYIADSGGLTVMSGESVAHQFPVSDITDFQLTRAGKLTSAAFSRWPDLPQGELQLHGKRWGKELPRIMVWDNAVVETAERDIRSVLGLPPLLSWRLDETD